MSDLPTCWYCPECGYLHQRYAHQRQHGSSHIRPDHAGPGAGLCTTPCVQIPVFPPGTPLTDILAALGIEYRVGRFYVTGTYRSTHPDAWVAYGNPPPDQKGNPVLVVDNPKNNKENENA